MALPPALAASRAEALAALLEGLPPTEAACRLLRTVVSAAEKVPPGPFKRRTGERAGAWRRAAQLLEYDMACREHVAESCQRGFTLVQAFMEVIEIHSGPWQSLYQDVNNG